MKKTLILVRHAKSSWKFPELNDFERPLNGRGKQAIPLMAKRLLESGLSPQLFISSPAKSAKLTCEGFAKSLHINDIKYDQSLYHAGASELINCVKSVDNVINVVALFGHNPGMTDFANQLTNTYLDNLPTCGIFACRLEIDDWNEFSLEKGEFLLFDYPKRIV